MTQLNVNIAGRLYPLKIRKEEENIIRDAEKLVSQKIQEYRSSYDGKDTQDYLAMVLINLAVQWVSKGEEDSKGVESLAQKLGELEAVFTS
ncbi:MAG: cell division protein ZapA [Chitinophagales bacterium]|jgi:cell division protein ZapA (FtsZ GTPase activity inhibitor)|nr:cell division protein ZapA [Chitinophagales bacterium]MBP6516459.1 cell division protein ZapA [Chitinophagales bacterium]